MGDSVMAVWGRDSIREDDPEKAIRAALDIQACLKEAATDGESMPIVMRVGIHTGLAMVDTSGGQDATVMGDTVNLAARLEPRKVY
jgi:class 3 adenylate cyclase